MTTVEVPAWAVLCNGDVECETDGPLGTSWQAADALAEAAGWLVDGDRHLCPRHRGNQ